MNPKSELHPEEHGPDQATNDCGVKSRADDLLDQVDASEPSAEIYTLVTRPQQRYFGDMGEASPSHTVVQRVY